MAIVLGNTAASLGGALGEGLARALNKNIDEISQNKLAEIHRRNDMLERNRLSRTLQALPGINPGIADFISNLSPDERKNVFQNLGSLLQLGELQSRVPAESALQDLIAGPTRSQQSAEPLRLFGKEYPSLQESISELPKLSNIEKAREVQQTQKITAPEQAKLIEDIFTSPKEKREREKFELEKATLKEKQEAGRFKETKEDRREIIEKGKAARRAIHDLNRMQELESTGKLDTPGYVEFLHRAGLDISSLMNPESEEFQKIANNFTANAKNHFGGRVSNFEVEQFLKTVPSLSQSPEGRKRVIANLKYLYNGDLEYNKALKEVLAEHKGVPPYDLIEKIDDKIDSKLDSLSEKFKADLAKPVPKAQNKLATALESSLGSVIGGIGKAAKSFGGALHGLSHLVNL
jgi:hypothetical protein